jgi:hypothetical protein
VLTSSVTNYTSIGARGDAYFQVEDEAKAEVVTKVVEAYRVVTMEILSIFFLWKRPYHGNRRE